MLIVYRITGGPVFGSPNEEYSVGDTITSKFATPLLTCAGVMAAWNDQYMLEQYHGYADWKLVVIETEQYHVPGSDEKLGYSPCTDECEVVVDRGTVVEVTERLPLLGKLAYHAWWHGRMRVLNYLMNNEIRCKKLYTLLGS